MKNNKSGPFVFLLLLLRLVVVLVLAIPRPGYLSPLLQGSPKNASPFSQRCSPSRVLLSASSSSSSSAPNRRRPRPRPRPRQRQRQRRDVRGSSSSSSSNHNPSRRRDSAPIYRRPTPSTILWKAVVSRARGGAAFDGRDDKDDDNYYYPPPSSSSSSSSKQHQQPPAPPSRGNYDYNDDSPRNSRSSQQYERDDYYYDDYGYDDNDDRGRSRRRGSQDGVGGVVGDWMGRLPDAIKNGDRRIGLMLVGSGALTLFLGMTLMFNRTLMRLGNLLFIAGVPVTAGPARIVKYFARPEKMRATACLAAGIVLVLIGWPFLGIVLEVFGLLNLFGNMFPIVWAMVKNMPLVSSIMNSSNSNNGGGGGGRRRDDYYNDYYDNDDDDDRGGYYNDYGRRSPQDNRRDPYGSDDRGYY